MLKRYGQKVIDELKAKKRETKQFTIQELEELIEILKQKNANIQCC